MIRLPHELCEACSLREIVAVADTPRSFIFRARSTDDEPVVAKLLKPAGWDEKTGFDYLDWRSGHGAVRLLARTDSACLIDDAGHITLADFQRREGDEAATAIIADVVRALHARTPKQVPYSLTPLEDVFQPLLAVVSSRLTKQERELLGQAATLAERLIGEQGMNVPLHGDIHHDNILSPDERTWRAIDPKGYLGSPAYDVANAFGNPVGAVELVLDPARIWRLARSFAPLFGVSETHVLEWAVAHAGLSACWSLERSHEPQEQTNVVERLGFVERTLSLLSR